MLTAINLWGTVTAFHSLSHFPLITTQLNLSSLKKIKLLQNGSEIGTIFSQPPLISFKRDKNMGNFLVRSSFQTSDQPGTFKCARPRCKTCPFIPNVEKMLAPKRSIKITDHFTCTSANVIYCITCTDEGLTLETSAFKLFTVANLPFQLSCKLNYLLYSPTDAVPQFL